MCEKVKQTLLKRRIRGNFSNITVSMSKLPSLAFGRCPVVVHYAIW